MNLAQIQSEEQIGDQQEEMGEMMSGFAQKQNNYQSHMSMMRNHSGFNSWHYGLCLITWIVFIALLISITRYFWKKAGK